MKRYEPADAPPLRLFYAAGPGDVAGTFRHWLEGRDDPNEVSVTLSRQFFDICQELKAEALVLSSHPRSEVLEVGRIRVENRPGPPSDLRGLRYHLAQIQYVRDLAAEARSFRSDLAIFSGIGHWFMLEPLVRQGVQMIPSMHCVLWPKYRPLKGIRYLIAKRNTRLFQQSTAILSHSHDISRQLTQHNLRIADKILLFRPTYRPGHFEESEPPEMPPFRVLFAGRIERDKGVFDLLEVAQVLLNEEHRAIEFDICGNGGAFQELQTQVQKAGINDQFRLHGKCDRPTMISMYKSCHIVVVPTTTDFIEGFNMVVAEGILSGRPVVTSSVCPALDYVREAIVEVPPDDVRAYADAIRRLVFDRDFYRSKRAACATLKDQFMDEKQGWGAALREAIARSRETSQN